MNAKSASTTLTDAPDSATIGATIAALLDQMPDTAFATRLRDAFGTELVRIYSMGLKHGSGNAWNAIDNAWADLGLTKPASAVVSRPRLTLVSGGAR